MSAQSMQALQLANETRFARSAIRAWVKEPATTVDSRERLAAILDGPVPDELRTLQLEEFMRWGWKMTPARIRGVCHLAQCSAFRPLGQLTDRQRTIIARALRASHADIETARGDNEFTEWMRRAA